jgi:hypothetical protein
MNQMAINLTLHGSIVLLIGLLSGIPYGIAINQKKNEDIARAWRVAHSGLSMGGTTMISISAVLNNLELNAVLSLILVGTFAISGYGFCIALPYGAWVGHRGLSIESPVKNKVVYVGNMVGAIGSLIGTLILVFGCLMTVV